MLFCNLLIYVVFIVFEENKNKMQKKNNEIYFSRLKIYD